MPTTLLKPKKTAKERGREYRSLHREKANKASLDCYHRTDPRVRKDRRLRAKYGISIDEYERLLLEQNHRCAICESDDPKGHGQWHVDHCHKTGRVRGILCSACNKGIGLLGDDPERMIKASRYLLNEFDSKTSLD